MNSILLFISTFAAAIILTEGKYLLVEVDGPGVDGPAPAGKSPYTHYLTYHSMIPFLPV